MTARHPSKSAKPGMRENIKEAAANARNAVGSTCNKSIDAVIANADGERESVWKWWETLAFKKGSFISKLLLSGAYLSVLGALAYTGGGLISGESIEIKGGHDLVNPLVLGSQFGGKILRQKAYNPAEEAYLGMEQKLVERVNGKSTRVVINQDKK